MAGSVGVAESRPHLANRQQHHPNIQAQKCSGHLCLNLTIPLLDHLITGLDTRFDEASSYNITKFMLLLPSANSNGTSTHSIYTDKDFSP